MSILLVGLNHRTAPVEIREQLAFSRDGAATALLLFRNQFPGSEAAILSTCNRVEILIASDTDRPDLNDMLSFLAQARDLPVNHFKNYLYQFSGEKAVRHLFRVASGMDSMVVGESQDRTLHEAGGKGLFVKELEQSLLAGEIDFAVHSFKDVPVTMPLVDQSDLLIAAVPAREDPRDVLVCATVKRLADLP